MTEPKKSKSPWGKGGLPPKRDTRADELAERRRQQRKILPDTRKRDKVSANHERSLMRGYGLQ